MRSLLTFISHGIVSSVRMILTRSALWHVERRKGKGKGKVYPRTDHEGSEL